MANDKAGHLPVPFDITPFSSTPTIAAIPHKRDWVPIAICTSPVIHLVCNCNCAVSSLRASSPFGGYREKKTREIHATGDAKVGGGPSRLRRSLEPSLATRFARPNRRACSQPMLYEWRFSFYPPFPSSPVNSDCVLLSGHLRVFVCEYFKGISGC